MAAAWLRKLAGDRIEVRSAGSEPADEINPVAVQAMQEVGIDLTNEQPKLLTTDDVAAADVVITMGCGDACPVYPGKRYEDWEIADPAGRSIDEVSTIRDQIRAKVEELVAGPLGTA
jgi:arsenate reductase